MAMGLILLVVPPGRGADRAALLAAVQSVTSDDLMRHVAHLAGDTFEGREAGSSGGRAAGMYLIGELERHGLTPAGDAGYFQSFNNGFRNILATIPGDDPLLAEQVVQVGAHYDHVGYGTKQNSYGPIGYIHNGADDNASGVAGLLELIEAIATSGIRPRRTILFTFWDGEEKGLLGSKHWLGHPTLPLDRLRTSINLDMIGRLRQQKMELFGARTGAGFRELFARQNPDPDLAVHFNWEMRDDSDHHPFFVRGIPVVMFHTGLHDQYHRPSDDPETLNTEGMQQVSRFLLRSVIALANADQLPAFRAQSRQEGPSTQAQIERGLPPLPGRLGVLMDTAPAENPGVGIVQAPANSPAGKAGIRAGDRILQVAGREVRSADELRQAVLLADSPAEFVVAGPGEADGHAVWVELAGAPVRIGISWRYDDAEPNCVTISRVVNGSAASAAGLQVNDRVLAVGGERFAGSEEFQTLVLRVGDPTTDAERPNEHLAADASTTLTLLTERDGFVREVSFAAPPSLRSPVPADDGDPAAGE